MLLLAYIHVPPQQTSTAAKAQTSLHAMQPMKKGLATESSGKPVTMPVSAEEPLKASRVTPQMARTSSMSSKSDNSVVSMGRSSSSSYHSASNYEERFEGFVPYSSNMEPPTKHSLVQHDSSVSSSQLSSTYLETPRQVGSAATAQAKPETGTQSKVSDKTLSEQKLAQQEREFLRKKAAGLSLQFCEAVRKWNEEQVEKILASEEGVNVDMVVDEKVRKCTPVTCFNFVCYTCIHVS